MGSSLSISSRDLHRLYGPVMTCDMCSTCVPMCSHVFPCDQDGEFFFHLRSHSMSIIFRCRHKLPTSILLMARKAMLSRCPCSVCWAAVGSDAMSKPRVPVAEIFGDMDARQVHYPTISTDMWSRYQLDAVIALLITKDHHGINMNKPHFRVRVDRKNIAQISVAAPN